MKTYKNIISRHAAYMKVANRSTPDGLNSWTFIVKVLFVCHGNIFQKVKNSGKTQ